MNTDMMSSREYGKPVRPPRSSKTTRDTTTGYLMKIIQTLSISQDNTERDKQKEVLEKEYCDCDRTLGRLVAAHEEDLIIATEAFSKNSTNLKTSISNCRDIRDKLTRCKTLLHCRTDELKRLYLEALEHKHVMSLLKETENIISVHEKIEVFLEDKMYLDATKLLVSSILLIEGNLEGIDGLKELKTELYYRREELHQILILELNTVLYLSASDEILKRFKRHGSGRLRLRQDPTGGSENLGGTPLRETLKTNISVEENLSLSEVKISNLVECLSMLNRIPESIEILKDKCQAELLAIVRRTAQHVADTSQNVPFTYELSYLGSVQNQDEHDLLFDLLELIFHQFRCVIHNHKALLCSLELHKVKCESLETCDKNGELKEPSAAYEMADIWSKIEAVIEVFVAEYVGDVTTSESPAPSAFTKLPTMVDMCSFFLKKKNAKAKNYSLFRFDSSSHAINMRTYLTEQKDVIKEKGDFDGSDSEKEVYICPSASKNIRIIFKPLSKFLSDIMEEINIESANCPLYAFINSCVKVFIGQITMEVNNVSENAAKSLENWKIIFDSEEMKKENVTTRILHSTVSINNSMNELSGLIFALPPYSSHFLSIICSMLESYRESCQSAYASLVQPHCLSEEKRIISSAWAKDSDISRLLRSLPNYPSLKEENSEESPEEIRLRNKKESEILITNLSGDALISQQEILLDTRNLYNLGILRESMEWLSSNILALSEKIPNQLLSPDNSVMNVEEIDHVCGEVDTDAICVCHGTVDSLRKFANDFESLGDTCLLLLHLEVRVHCFYHLQPLALQGCYISPRLDNQEPDPEIIRLNTDVSKIYEALECVLNSCNMKYVFEGLGELISTILINSASKIRRINENGVKKINRNIFALQQNLTGITMFREVALDRARQYFDLLNHTPEEILNLIVENGPQFHELEYSSVFHLLQRIQPGSDHSLLESYLERLHQILNEVAVSV